MRDVVDFGGAVDLLEIVFYSLLHIMHTTFFHGSESLGITSGYL